MHYCAKAGKLSRILIYQAARPMMSSHAPKSNPKTQPEEYFNLVYYKYHQIQTPFTVPQSLFRHSMDVARDLPREDNPDKSAAALPP